MSLVYQERLSDSPYIELVTHGQTQSVGRTIRPAESHWHMVFVKVNDCFRPIIVGPLSMAGIASWEGEAEIVWVKFKLGTFMPHLPAKNLMNKETFLPEAGKHSFWLNSTTWELPTHENVETFVQRLARNDIVRFDPVVKTALEDHPQDVSPRTLRHRFLHTIGLSQNNIRQIERAQRASFLLEQGKTILDTVYEVGYFDQPHMTRSLKQWVGYTPAQIIAMGEARRG